jgi:hypothetical protein
MVEQIKLLFIAYKIILLIFFLNESSLPFDQLICLVVMVFLFADVFMGHRNGDGAFRVRARAP